MYSMAAFGPVLGFLLGAYLLSFHMDSFSGTIISIGKKELFLKICIKISLLLFFHMKIQVYNVHWTDPGDHRWVGMWWGGFLLCGLLLILVAVPFFSFPKTLQREKEKIRIIEKNKPITQKEKEQQSKEKKEKMDDSGYGKDVKGKLFWYTLDDFSLAKNRQSFC